MSMDHPTTARTYYDHLGLTPQASFDEIKTAYRRLALAHHPDRPGTADRRMAELRFRAINEAYAHLKHPVRRAQYDAALQTTPYTRAAANDAYSKSLLSRLARWLAPAKARS